MSRYIASSISLAAMVALAACGDQAVITETRAHPQIIASLAVDSVTNDSTVDTLRVRSPEAATVSEGSSVQTIEGLGFPCGGEPMQITGTVSYRWHTTQLPSGDWMRTQHTVFATNGEGTLTGVKYIGRGTANDTQVFAMPAGGAFTYEQTVQGIGIVQGSADNDIFQLRAGWVINANGVPTFERFEVRYECRG